MSAVSPPTPEDPEQLRARLAEMTALVERQNSVLLSLTAERDHFRAAYEEAEAERQKLDRILQQLNRAQSGPKSERLDPDQFQLALENVEQDLAAAAAAREEAAAGNPGEARRKRRAPANAYWATCPGIWSARRSVSSRRTRPARAAAAPCT
jgi:Asp-tRNA(Asn)/Glu-tRNA(Gln) amidotransferase B subunit